MVDIEDQPCYYSIINWMKVEALQSEETETQGEITHATRYDKTRIN